MKAPHWHVLGAGAMGCLFAGTLQRAGHPVTLLLRERRGQPEVPVTIEENGASKVLSFPTSLPDERTAISHLLVTTKAYDVCPAVMSIAHRLGNESQVVLLANGLGYAEELKAKLPRLDCYLGTTTQGAYRIGPLHICHAGRGATRIGRPNRNVAPDWFRYWSAAVKPGSWDTDIERSLWLKLAINCAINPLTALHNCTNGELAGPHLSPQVLGLCEEIACISAAAGFVITPAQLHQQVSEVIAGTAANRSSMLQDIIAKRRTEIDYITGHLVAVGRSHGIAAPLNENLLERIMKLDR